VICARSCVFVSFYCAMLCRACLSVHPSVMFRYHRDHIGWKSSEIIALLVSLGRSLSADPNITDLLQGGHPKIIAEIGWGTEKWDFDVQKL